MTTDHRNTRILAELFSYLASDMEEVNLNALLNSYLFLFQKKNVFQRFLDLLSETENWKEPILLSSVLFNVHKYWQRNTN